MKYLLCVLVLMSQSFFAHAECASAYKDEIKVLEGRMNPPRSTMITNVIAEGAVVSALVVFTGAAPVGAIVALPAAALGGTAYYTGLLVRRNGFRNGMNVLRDAHKGSGKTLDRFMKILGRKMDHKLDKQAAIDLLVQGDFDGKFCQMDEVKNTAELYSFRKLLRFAKKTLTNVDDSSFDNLTDAEITL